MTSIFETKIVNSGRITIPKEVRDKLQLEEGDMVRVSILSKLVLTEQEVS